MTIPATSQTIGPIAGESAIPPLEPGDRLSRDEFERRFAAMPKLKKAELIEGVVYMPSPVQTSITDGPTQIWSLGSTCTARQRRT
jgi:hypothetical protein